MMPHSGQLLSRRTIAQMFIILSVVFEKWENIVVFVGKDIRKKVKYDFKIK